MGKQIKRWQDVDWSAPELPQSILQPLVDRWGSTGDMLTIARLDGNRYEAVYRWPENDRSFHAIEMIAKYHCGNLLHDLRRKPIVPSPTWADDLPPPQRSAAFVYKNSATRPLDERHVFTACYYDDDEGVCWGKTGSPAGVVEAITDDGLVIVRHGVPASVCMSDSIPGEIRPAIPHSRSLPYWCMVDGDVPWPDVIDVAGCVFDGCQHWIVATRDDDVAGFFSVSPWVAWQGFIAQAIYLVDPATETAKIHARPGSYDQQGPRSQYSLMQEMEAALDGAIADAVVGSDYPDHDRDERRKEVVAMLDQASDDMEAWATEMQDRDERKIRVLRGEEPSPVFQTTNPVGSTWERWPW